VGVQIFRYYAIDLYHIFTPDIKKFWSFIIMAELEYKIILWPVEILNDDGFPFEFMVPFHSLRLGSVMLLIRRIKDETDLT
jgi:hypothetical protein